MKFQKLEIKNIASINDATIAFDETPLANDPLFLICGATGSGKSTILDAICLALYGTAPRLEGYGNESYDDKKLNITGDDDKVRISHPCQLVRRDTGEAYARLSFTGNNGKHYVATWHATRGTRKKLDVKLKHEHTLYCIEDNTTIAKRTTDEIARPEVIGLKFEEFCRTTLLAQGGFTRFLNSKSSEKSDILEKLTGTEIYSHISREIYRSYTAKNQKYEEKKAILESLKLLSPEEREEKMRMIAEEEKNIASLKKECEEIEKKIVWLNRCEEFQKAKEEAKEFLERLTATANTPEIENERRLVEEWNNSADVRRCYEELRKIVRERETITNNTEASYKKYLQLFIENISMYRTLQQTRDSLKTIQDKIANAAADIPMYENAGALVAKMQETMRKSQEGSEVRKECEEMQKQLPEITSQLKELLLKRKKEEDLLLKKDEEYISAKKEQENQPSSETIETERIRIENIASLLKERGKTLERLNSFKQKLNELEKSTQESAIKRKSAEKEKEEAAAHLKQCEELYSTMLMRIDNHAKALRARLKTGDTCPVCGETVRTILQDDELMELIAPVELQLDNAKKVHEEKAARLNEILIQMESRQELFKTTAKEIEKEEIKKNELALQLEALCKDGGITAAIDNLPTIIDEEKKRLAIQQQKTDTLSKKVLDISKEILEKRKSLTSIVEQQAHTMSKQKRITDRLEEQKTRLVTIEQDCTLLRKDISEGNITIADWESDIANSIDKLQKRASAYQTAKERVQELTQKVKQLSELAERIEHLKQQIDVMQPLWRLAAENNESDERQFHAEVEKEWVELLNRCNVLKSDEDRCKENYKLCTETIRRFHDSNSSITPERIKAIMQYDTTQIHSMQERHNSLKQEIGKSKALADEWNKKYEALQETRPQFNDDEKAASLNTHKANIEELRSQAEKRVGGVVAELEIDRQKSKQVEKEQAEAALLLSEASKWKRLSDIFGSAEGNKFKAIAQSYILSQLLENANYYLRQFTTRYTLTTQPGSLIILITDQEEGEVSRPANTLSGGESFMVSLALALGLSSLNNNMFTPDTLFIDEGFGTLSGDCLNTVIETLEVLHSIGNRRVGIISHVNELYERIATRIEIKKERGVSRVKIVG